MDTPPADSPAPERPTPWWRHRRRLFYLAVTGATLAMLWGGWVWWYRADFPVPTEEQCRVVGMGRASYGRWVVDPKWKLYDWKVARETHRLRLPGTVWRDEDADVTLTFGTDGRLSVKGTPGWEDRVASFTRDPFSHRSDAAKAALAALHLTPYQFHPTVPVRMFQGGGPNLSLPDSPWDGFLEADSHSAIYLLLEPETGSQKLPPYSFLLTRQPDAP